MVVLTGWGGGWGGVKDFGYVGRRLMTRTYECLNSQCVGTGEVPLSSYLLKSQGRPVIRAV